MKNPLPRRNVTILSPLRYPGAKRRLASYVAAMLEVNDLKPELLVEPFAGGASVALQLLNDGVVEAAILADLDPLVAGFWRTVFWDHEWLLDEMRTTPVTVENWDYFRSGTWRTDRERAMACLFLNRTSFSGIISDTAGPIGGRRQQSQYRIDCRFPVQTLAKRIKQAAALGGRVLAVYSGSWKSTLAHVARRKVSPRQTLFYLDPPFYRGAARLYRHYFGEGDHDALRDVLVRMDSPWILSYDAAEEIVGKYTSNGHHPEHVELLYSAASSGKPSRIRELVMTNLEFVPRANRLWRTAQEWRPSATNGRTVGR